MLNDLCFEIIQKCTNNCEFCSSCSSMKAINIIEYELFKSAIDYIMKNGGLKEISISGGEPFLHKDLVKMVKLCTEYGIKTNVYTSGIIENRLRTMDLNYKDYSYGEQLILNKLKESEFSNIDKEKLKELKSVGLNKIVFDFQATECESYNELMGTSGNLCYLLHSMLNAKVVGLDIEVHFIPMKTNYKEIEDILEICDLAEVSNVSILKFVPQGRGRINKDKLSLTDIELTEFSKSVQLIKKNYKVNVRLGIPMVSQDMHLCTAGHDKLSIRYDGLVLPCVAFKEMDSSELEAVFLKNGVSFKLFSIRDNLDMLVSTSGSNKFPLCKQVYGNL